MCVTNVNQCFTCTLLEESLQSTGGAIPHKMQHNRLTMILSSKSGLSCKTGGYDVSLHVAFHSYLLQSFPYICLQLEFRIAQRA